MEVTAHFAPVVVLLFLGTTLLVGASLLVNDRGWGFAPSSVGQMTFDRINGPSRPLTQGLRPGESYTTEFVFDVPKDAQGLRLLITEDDPETRFVIGHENSFLHKKIYFGLDSVRQIGSDDFTLPRVLTA